MLLQKSRFFPLLMLSFVVLTLNCSKEKEPDVPVITENVMDFLPLKIGNYWIYEVATFDSNEVLQDYRTEKWSVDSCCYHVNIYDITDTVMLLGDRSYISNDSLWIYDPVDKFLTVLYLNFSEDSLILVATGNDPVPYEHYIFGDQKELLTEFGFKNYICTKTVFHPGSRKREESYEYFTAGIGKIAQRNLHFDNDFSVTEPYAKKTWMLVEYFVQ